MKKTIKIAALMIVIVMAVFAFASCAKTLKGEYVCETIIGNTSYEFDGKEFKYNGLTSALDYSGTYEIDEDAGEITFTYEYDGEEQTVTSSFSEGEEDGVEYIKIDGIKYNKK